jgi:hypothetical protein
MKPCSRPLFTDDGEGQSRTKNKRLRALILRAADHEDNIAVVYSGHRSICLEPRGRVIR